MRRRVIKQGHDTLTVTLPSTWTKRYNISAGDELEIAEQEKNLMISSTKGSNLASITIDVSGMTSVMIWRNIIAAYRAGYDEIIVTGTGKTKKQHSIFSMKGIPDKALTKKYSTINPTDIVLFATSLTMRTSFEWDKFVSPSEAVIACVNRLIGMELIDQHPDYFKIKEMGETTYKEFDNALRRIFVLTKTEFEYLQNALNGDRTKLDEIFMVDSNLDRFVDFCLRVLNKKGYIEYRKTSVMHSLIIILEFVGDELKKIGKHLLVDQKLHSKLIQNVSKDVGTQIDRFYDLFYKFSKEKVEAMCKEDVEFKDRIDKLSKNATWSENEVLLHYRKIYVLLLSLTDLRINMEF